MNGLEKMKALMKKIGNKSQSEEKNNMYEGLENTIPFTVLENDQMRSFISELSREQSLEESERGAFKELWNAMCIDMDGFGNNIWNLKNGNFVIYQKDGVEVQFEKESKGIDIYTDQGRANFTFKSNDGGFIINQNERNRRIFLLLVSEGMSDRLLAILRKAEIKVLGLKEENDLHF